MANKKIYFYADTISKEGRESIIFRGQNGMRGHRAWGNKEQVNFILEKLVEKHWMDEGCLIYRKFNEALLEVSIDEKAKERRKFPKAVLVLFERTDDNSLSSTSWDNKNPDEALHKRESGHQEDGEGKKETSSSNEV